MKLIPFIFAAAAGVATAKPAPVAQRQNAASLTATSPASTGMANMPGMVPPAGAATADTSIPAGVNIEPRLETQAKKDGAQRSTIDYGPYALPAMGMITKMELRGKVPCTACYITGIQARIKYQDGKEANVDTGAWLHHMVIAKGIAPIFASGNERTPLRTNGAQKYGIEMNQGDSFMIMTDLMSNSNENKNIVLEMMYEFIPKAQATGYKAVYMKWNDVGNPTAKEGVYSFSTRDWTSTVSGRLLYTNGHVHDGGTDTRLFLNGKEICRSTMLYGRRPGFTENASAEAMPGMESHAHTGLHISDSSTCQNFGDIKVGDKMHIEAWYDTQKFGLMEHNGKKEALMGIMRVYIGT